MYALAAYCALQRDARVEERGRARFAGERLVASTEATLFPFKHGATNIRSRWRERFPPAPDDLTSMTNPDAEDMDSAAAAEAANAVLPGDVKPEAS